MVVDDAEGDVARRADEPAAEIPGVRPRFRPVARACAGCQRAVEIIGESDRVNIAAGGFFADEPVVAADGVAEFDDGVVGRDDVAVSDGLFRGCVAGGVDAPSQAVAGLSYRGGRGLPDLRCGVGSQANRTSSMGATPVPKCRHSRISALTAS